MQSTFRRIAWKTGVVAILLLTQSSLVRSETNQWVSVMTDDRERTWYVDSGSIRSRGNARFFWSYVVANSPYLDSGKMVYGTAYYLSVDCSSQQFRLRFARLLDQNSKTIREFNYGDSRPLALPNPDSGEAASLKYVCARR